MNVRQAVVMVGGKGTRLRPLTNNRPKPILPVLDRPCLSYLIESLAKGGIEEVILACGYRSEKMKEAIGNGSGEGTVIDYSYEDVPMGTAGAIKLLEDRLDDVFVAVNGDVFADIDLKKEIDEHKRTGASITISLTRVENPCEFGIARLDGDGRILEFKEKPKPEEVFSDLINAGVYVMEKEVLKHVPKGQMYDFSKELTIDVMNKGYRVQGHMLNGIWMDVGRPKDLLRANITAAERWFSDHEWNDVTKGSKITKPLYIGQGGKATDSKLSQSIISKGSAVRRSEISGSLIMADCDICDATISGSIIGEGCIIKRGSIIVDSVVADDVIIEENTTVRERTVEQ
ncbi:MAG: NDP-sugar synthase [Methanomassiliicoccaceae archaeon]|jgi:mannose-1-phosphate guanylyltransferase|nr:NDP-sugar synthase [Methanomassiliicoccaceae archaeon]